MTAPRYPEFPDLEPALAGQFTIERELGRGGMGVVLLAHDLMLDRPVALKVLPTGLAERPSMRERFLREARTAARLSHPNIVPVYRADDVQGIAFFAMAYVEGESLADRLRERGRLPAAESVRILREVAWALAYAHAHGVVHRDVKPENILLDRASGRAIVTDFGIAQLAEASRLTQDGHVLGTVHYMSPEQARGDALDGRSDIYSLGVVAYQMLSGHLPFEGMPAAAVVVAHATRDPIPLRELAPDLPASLDMIVGRCLAKNPEARPATGEALAELLGQALATTPEQDTLPPGLPPVLDEADAEVVWRRAAQLQADALRRLEERRDLLQVGTSELTRLGGATGASEQPPTGARRLRDVVEAAAEAGISRQYMAMALAELPRAGQVVERAPVAGVSDRVATRYLGMEERSLGVSVVVEDSPARVLRAVGTVLQQGPYELRLRETVGGHPLDGGVLVFDLPGTVWTLTSMYTDRNSYWTSARQALEAAQVQVTLRSLPGDPARTELTMMCDLRPGVRRNVQASRLFTAGGGVIGVLLGGAAGSAAAVTTSLGAGVLVGLPAAAGAAVVGLGTLAWYRWLYRHEAGKARDEMRRALEGVAASIRAERVFGSVPGPALPRMGDADPYGAP